MYWGSMCIDLSQKTVHLDRLSSFLTVYFCLVVRIIPDFIILVTQKGTRTKIYSPCWRNWTILRSSILETFAEKQMASLNDSKERFVGRIKHWTIKTFEIKTWKQNFGRKTGEDSSWKRKIGEKTEGSKARPWQDDTKFWKTVTGNEER